MNQNVTQIWWFKRMVAVVTIPNDLHILADVLYVGKITPVDGIQQISVHKMFRSICWIANYPVDSVNHPSNNQGQVFWTQRRQYCYLVLPVPFLLGWLFGSMSCRFLYTHPTTTDPEKDKSMYFLQAIKEINPMSVGFGSKACENLWAVLHEKLRQRCFFFLFSDWRRQVIQTVICKIRRGNINVCLPFVYVEVKVTCILAVSLLDFQHCRTKKLTSCLWIIRSKIWLIEELRDRQHPT